MKGTLVVFVAAVLVAAIAGWELRGNVDRGVPMPALGARVAAEEGTKVIMVTTEDAMETASDLSQQKVLSRSRAI